MAHKKSQAWIADFILATLIFSFMLIAYYTYTINISQRDSDISEDLLTDAESLTSSILLAGFPANWDNKTVQSIGITNNDQKLNRTKISNFGKIAYNRSRSIFGTAYDYFLFFTDENGTVLNMEGSCGFGNPSINTSPSADAAYYHSDSGGTIFKPFAESLNADIYYETGSAGVDDFDALVANINNYRLVIMEHPNLDGSEFNSNKDALEDFVSSGNYLLISGLLATPATNSMLGVDFKKHAGESVTNLNATTIVEDKFVSFDKNSKIAFAQAYYVTNESISPVNFTEIAKFDESDVSEPRNNAIARWIYGSGNVLFFSDFDAIYFADDFLDIATKSVIKWADINCNPLDLNPVTYKNFVKIERFLIYDDIPVKMVLYIWQ